MKTTRVVFLDVDGVLNSRAHYGRKLDAGGFSDIYDQIDPECVARLNRLLKESGAVIVMSSTWRSTLTKTRDLCRRIGIKPDRLIGVTPSLAHPRYSGLVIGKERGHEIQAWLNENAAHWLVEDFVILDDSDDMVHLAPKLLQTDDAVGLTDADVDRAVAMFEGRA